MTVVVFDVVGNLLVKLLSVDIFDAVVISSEEVHTVSESEIAVDCST